MKNKFKSQKKEQKFAIIRNFISSDKAKKLSEEFKNYCEENPEDCPSDDQIPNTPAKHNYISFLEILCQKTSEVSEIIGESVLPTYSYARIYKNGDILKKHTDRDACEVSLTVHLDGDSEWEIFVESSNNESQSIKLQSGVELIGKLHAQDISTVTLSKPLVVDLTMDPQTQKVILEKRG